MPWRAKLNAPKVIRLLRRKVKQRHGKLLDLLGLRLRLRAVLGLRRRWAATGSLLGSIFGLGLLVLAR